MQRGDVTVTKVASQDNHADPFTKTLPTKVFMGHLESLGLQDMFHMLEQVGDCWGFCHKACSL